MANAELKRNPERAKFKCLNSFIRPKFIIIYMITKGRELLISEHVMLTNHKK